MIDKSKKSIIEKFKKSTVLHVSDGKNFTEAIKKSVEKKSENERNKVKQDEDIER